MNPFEIDYNPFGKSLSRLTGRDLLKLRDVAEGWFVEYKGEAPGEGIRAVSKSLCAFANQHGGWLFFGIRAKNGKYKTPESFPGLGDVEARELELSIRNAAQHVSPSVEYRLRSVKGPVADIDLAEGKEVLVVLIPEGARSPYIHSTGYIYRRFDDESRPERDRFAIESLYERSSKRRRELARFLNWTPTLSKGESDDVSFLHLWLMSDPLRDLGHFSRMEFQEFAAIMKAESDSPNFGISLENAFMMAGGFVARQIRGQDPYDLRFTWRYYMRDCSSLISLPIRSAKIGSPDVSSCLSGYKNSDEFVRTLQSAGLDSGRVLDLLGLPRFDRHIPYAA